MLLNLHIKNMALIKEIDVDFTKGLIVFTGETGAGKSLILGSVNIALGQKASKELIRQGTDYMLVELTFCVSPSEEEILKALDIHMEDNTVTVTRKISEGRSISKINGEAVNLVTLKKVMTLLLDIYGQHEHQSLLYAKNHLTILDTFAADDMSDLLRSLNVSYNKYLQLKDRLSTLNMDESTRLRELEIAEHEVQEIRSVNLRENEDQDLERKFTKISNGKKILEVLSNISSHIGNDSEMGAEQSIGRAIYEINSVADYDGSLKEMQNTLYEIEALCQQLSGEIYHYTSQLDVDEYEASQVSERFDIINRFKMKYGKTISEILEYADEKQEYIDQLTHLQRDVEQIKNEMKDTKHLMDQYCAQLSQIRKKFAPLFEQRVTQALQDLNFLSVQFKINFSKKDRITEKGYDNIEFLISTNPGQPLKPLSKIASGGELSRIMLAIKSVLATKDDTDTLIFDEIDVGISGKTAQKVAEKLAKISRKHQVICISHLSGIAAMADTHFLIEKQAEHNDTVTNIRELNESESILEIVRLNGGVTVTDAALEHAGQMKEMAKSVKCNLS